MSLSNVYYSFNGRQLGQREQQVLLRIPHDRLLLETDSPDQIPSSLSKYPFIRFNEPLFIRFTYRIISKILDIDIHDITRIIQQNIHRVYRLQ